MLVFKSLENEICKLIRNGNAENVNKWGGIRRKKGTLEVSWQILEHNCNKGDMKEREGGRERERK